MKILEKCKDAISNNGKGSGKVIIIDLVINEKKEDPELIETKLLYDMLMMFAVTGKQRTDKEWGELFLKAGFPYFKITNIFGLRSHIEVYP